MTHPDSPDPRRGGRGPRPATERSGSSPSRGAAPRGGRPGGAGGGGRGRPPGGDQRERLADRVYDPRREERRRRSRVELPDDITADQLDREVRADLRSLAKDTADLVARHLVATGRLLDEDPVAALAHARAASALGGRVAAVREAAGLAAYAAGEWQEAIGELRTFRRISGEAVHLPVLADCERALGRPERALVVGEDPDVARLDQATKVELALVVAGARRDLGQQEAAVVLLQGPARATTERHPWAARLWYGFADALLDAGRQEEAERWFAKVVDVDGGETDADERLLALQGWELGDDEPEDGSAGATHGPTGEDQDGPVAAGGTGEGRTLDSAAPDPAQDAPRLSSQELSDLVADVPPLAGRRPAAAVAQEARTGPAQRSAAAGDAADRRSGTASAAASRVDERDAATRGEVPATDASGTDASGTSASGTEAAAADAPGTRRRPVPPVTFAPPPSDGDGGRG